jgi:hypothetical protein
MKAGGPLRDSSGRARQAWGGAGRADAAQAWRGKDIGECRFKGTAGGQLGTDRRGEGGAAWPRPAGRVGAGGAAGPRSCCAVRHAEDASAREACLIRPEWLRNQISNSNFAERSPRMEKAATNRNGKRQAINLNHHYDSRHKFE